MENTYNKIENDIKDKMSSWYSTIVQLIFIILKLTKIIDCSWLIVFIPLWVGALIAIIGIIVLINIRKMIERIERSKNE